jgi:hypothetical protein
LVHLAAVVLIELPPMRKCIRTPASYDMIRLRLPVEVWVGGLFSSVWLVGVLIGLPISWPDLGNAPLLQIHFFAPLALGALLQLIVARIQRHQPTTATCQQADRWLMIKLFPLLALSVFLYFNFKAWMPLVNPRLYDEQFQRIDLLLAPLLDSMIMVRQAIAAHVPVRVDDWYLLLYLGIFLVSLGTHSVIDPPVRQRQLMLGLCLNLLLGGVAYWIAPAQGPFLYRAGVNVDVQPLQHYMLAVFQQVRATGELPLGYFVAPLGALPSLHVAHSLFFTLWAARSARRLLVFYVPVLFWIVIEAPASGWHYLVDLPAGALLAIVSFSLAIYLIPGDAPEGRPAKLQPRLEPMLATQALPIETIGSAALSERSSGAD